MEVIKREDGTYQHGVTLILDDSPPTCTVELGQARYSQAERVLEAIRLRLSKCRPSPMSLPGLDAVCRGDTKATEASRVPEAFRCSFLLQNINIIAGILKWTVHPHLNDLHPDQNAAIWFYDSDIGHSFSHRIFNIRYNVIVMTFLWALDEAGEGEGNFAWSKHISPSDARGRARYDFWRAYIEAWLAQLNPDGNFAAQLRFLELWQQSEFDLVLFRRQIKRRLDEVMEKLMQRMPKVPYGDPLKFLDLARSGDSGMNLEELRQAGPAYALHFVMASAQDANKFDKDLAQTITQAEEDEEQMKAFYLMNARMDRAIRLEDFQMANPADDDDDDFQDVHFPEDEDDDDDEMTEAQPVDLTRVKWDEEPMAHLLNVHATTDIGVNLAKNELPPMSRPEWIDQDEAINILWTKVDTIADIMDSLTLS